MRRSIPGFIILLLLVFVPVFCSSQELPIADVTYDFNDHSFNEKNNKLNMRAVGVNLVTDRFGNKLSAVRLRGQLQSYLNLGTSQLLKPKKGTISLWMNIDREIFTGPEYYITLLLLQKIRAIVDGMLPMLWGLNSQAII